VSWNYRVTREQVTNPDGSTEPFFAVREVHYDDEDRPIAWSKDPTTFVGDTPGEVVEALLRAAGAFPSGGVLDLDTKETVHLTYNGRPVKRDRG
jgi:hypothetical protein